MRVATKPFNREVEDFSGNEREILTTVNTIDADIRAEIRAKVHDVGTVVFPKIGGAIATNKRRILTRPTAIDNNCLGLTPGNSITTDWLFLVLSAIDLTEYQSGTSVPALSQKRLEIIATAVPPVPEQDRIVAQTSKLFALCDELEAKQTQKHQARTRLNEACLDRLLTAQTPDEFAEYWQRIHNNFDLLYDSADAVVALSEAIRGLAVRGKTIKPTKMETPGTSLLAIAAASKEAAFAAKTSRRFKQLEPIDEGQTPYSLPKGWVWTRLESICTQITDGAHHTPTYMAEGVPFLSVKDINKGFIDLSSTRFISEEQHQQLCKRCRPDSGDVLLTKIGTTGIAKVVDVDIEFSIFVSLALLKAPQEVISPEYLELVLNSPFVRQQSADNTRGVGNKNLVLTKIRNFLVPLPPRSTQDQVVLSARGLSSQVDALRQLLVHRVTSSERLLRSLTHHLAAGDNSPRTEQIREGQPGLELAL